MTHPLNVALERSQAQAKTLAAIHEAGHAVVARWAGLRPDLLRLNRNGGGECRHMEPRHAMCKTDLEPMRTHLAVAVAGIAAEQLSQGVDPLHAAVPPAEVAERILNRERAPHTRATTTRPPDTRRWAIDKLAAMFHDETLAYGVLDDVLAPDALRRATRVLRDRWAEVEHLAERLEGEGEITIER